jgi:hypothetical protein
VWQRRGGVARRRRLRLRLTSTRFILATASGGWKYGRERRVAVCAMGPAVYVHGSCTCAVSFMGELVAKHGNVPARGSPLSQKRQNPPLCPAGGGTCTRARACARAVVDRGVHSFHACWKTHLGYAVPHNYRGGAGRGGGMEGPLLDNWLVRERIDRSRDLINARISACIGCCDRLQLANVIVQSAQTRVTL